MRLKKANNPTLNYPSRERIKPILLSVTVAVALTACGQKSEVETPDNFAGGMPVHIPIVEENNSTQAQPFNPKKDFSVQEEREEEKVIKPEALGGIPALPPRD